MAAPQKPPPPPAPPQRARTTTLVTMPPRGGTEVWPPPDPRAVESFLTFVGNARDRDVLLHGALIRCLEVFEAERSTIFAIDNDGSVFSLAKLAPEATVIRVPRSKASIAGFVAATGRSVSVANAYDTTELARIDSQLAFDSRWDQSTGFRTRSMLAVPVVAPVSPEDPRGIVGVLQILNRRAPGGFPPDRLPLAESFGRALGAALARHDLSAGALLKTARKATKWDDLVDGGAISAADLGRALAEAAGANVDPARYLVETMKLDRLEVERSLARFYRHEFFRFRGKEAIPWQIKAALRPEYLKRMIAAPVEEGAGLVLVVDDPSDLNRVEEVQNLVNPDGKTKISVRIGFRDEILAFIDAAFKKSKDATVALWEQSEMEPSGADIDEEAIAGADAGEVADTDSAVVRMANQIVVEAFERGASDIHIEPNGREQPTVVRFRIDGDCVDYQELPPAFRNALVARFKIMASLDIAERRKPQDGKIRFRLPQGPIELRVATLPTGGGNEDVVMRILASSRPLPLEQMGFSARNLEGIRQLAVRPYGLVLCVGPTGSGKTTTLHSVLGHINKRDMKIWTAEDPIEITQKGLRQVQVQPKIGFTFAQAMRAFLRADPDVIMVGEMRDEETASTAVEASLTGHLVLSTLHTNSAPETVTRLIDIGLDPFSFSDALLGVLAQRLARGLCQVCKKPYPPSELELAAIRSAAPDRQAEYAAKGEPLLLWRAPGCEACAGTGYKGRLAIHELLIANDDLRRSISRRGTVEEMKRIAVESGMRTLFQDGIDKALAGKTDLKQVEAVCART